MGKKYSAAEETILRARQGKSQKETAAILTALGTPRSLSGVRQWYIKNHLPCRDLYTTEQHEYLTAHRHMRRADLTVAFNARFNTDHSERGIHSYCKRNGIYRTNSGIWNKGTRGLVPAPVNGFKKGNTPHTWRPVGAVRRDEDGYLVVKIANPNRWKRKHILVWEKHHGRLPPDHCLRFLDGDKNNCAIENLALVSRAANMRINSHTVGMAHLVTPETHKTVIAIANLKEAIAQRGGK